MKSVLYVGATLMIGASVYGFVDYKKSQRKQEFKTMYSAAQKTVDEPIVQTKAPENITVADKPVTKASKNVTKKTAVKTKKEIKTKKKRKLDVRLFSRGGLDDEYIEAEKKIPLLQKVQNK